MYVVTARHTGDHAKRGEQRSAEHPSHMRSQQRPSSLLWFCCYPTCIMLDDACPLLLLSCPWPVRLLGTDGHQVHHHCAATGCIRDASQIHAAQWLLKGQMQNLVLGHAQVERFIRHKATVEQVHVVVQLVVRLIHGQSEQHLAHDIEVR